MEGDLTIKEVLAAHWQFGRLDRALLEKAMGENWRPEYANLCEETKQ